LEEIKALLGMTAEDTASAPSQSKETTTEGANTEDSTADTKSEEKDATEPSASAEAHSVTVQPGDTLQTLAEKTGATPRHLIDMNMLMEPVVLRPGQTLNY
jgi:LysM repeat protein